MNRYQYAALPETPDKMVRIFYVNDRVIPIFRAVMIPYIGVFIKKKYTNDLTLLEHEMIHWRQFKRMGAIVFLIRYIVQFVFIGYDAMPFELEARQSDESYWNYRQRKWHGTTRKGIALHRAWINNPQLITK
jgi:hypothetical protein